MAYFPFFIDITGKTCLIVGGGAVALRKAQKLLPYGPRLTVVSPHFTEGFQELEGLRLVKEAYTPALLGAADVVIAATDDRELNREIAEECMRRRIPVNAVDDRDRCSFLFPALVKRGDLSVGISTGGASPSAAIFLKEAIQRLLPENIGEILALLEAVRPAVKAAIPSEECRAVFFRELFERCLQAEPLPDEGEIRRLLAEQAEEENG